MKDRSLFDAGPRDGNLTSKQQLVLDLLTSHGPLRAIDVGALMHQTRKADCGCGPGRVCKWAHGDASDVLRALRKRDLAIQRRGTGKWELMHPPADPDAYDPKTEPFPEGF